MPPSASWVDYSVTNQNWVGDARILVTGAAGTLGRGLVEEAVHQGARVAAAGRRPHVDQVRFPDGVTVLAGDLVDPGECRQLVASAVEALGGLDILINNAAVLIRSHFMDLTLDQLETSWAVNLRAPILLMQAATPHLEKGRSPAILNVVSTAGFTGGIAPVSPYAMTKAGLIILTKAVSHELGARGIRVNCLSPATLDSPMQASLAAHERERVRMMNALGRPATVEEVARVALFIASPYAAIVTGTTIDATGGVT
jgi:3-oxoacyl-[acyl-carrier protein] reductase